VSDAASAPDAPRRRADLLTAPLDDGRFVFDAERVRAHVLNRSADAVWQRCDGSMTTDAITASIVAALGITPGTPALPSVADVRGDVGRTIEHLRSEALLEGPEHSDATPSDIARGNQFRNVPHTGDRADGHDRSTWTSTSSTFRGLDFCFRVATDDAAFAAVVDAVLAPLRWPTEPGPPAALPEPVAEYTVSVADDRYALALDGFIVATDLEPGAAVANLLWHVNQMVSTSSTRLLQLHASGVTAAGITVAFPASMNSGKSTLVTALVTNGLAYVTDETLAIDLSSGLVHPYPKSIALDHGSWRLFPAFEEIGAGRDVRFAHHKWHLDPHRIGATVALPMPLGLVVFPRYTPGAKAAPERIDAARAAVELAQNAFNLVTVGQPGVDTIVATAQRVPCYVMPFDDLPEARARVADLVAAHTS
jgi:hypothetical protein